MESQRAIMLPQNRETTVDLQGERKHEERLLFLVVSSVVVFITPLVTLVAVNMGVSLLLSVLAVIVIGVIILRWPQAGFFVITACVVFIDEAPLTVPVFTDRLYVYYWPPALQGLIERPIGFLFLFILLVVICRRIAGREPFLRGGALIVPFLLFLLCVVGGAIYGYVTGGSLKVIIVELRPFVYLFESYLVACNLVTRKSHVRSFFWLVIVAAGVRALQGIYIYLKLHGQIGDSTLMSHEEFFFFIGLLLLVVLFSLHHRYKPQLFAALCVLPFVVATLVLNDRRADYVAFIAGLSVAWVLMFVINPRKRKALVIVLLVSAVLGSGYILLFAASPSGFAAPARSIVATFNPSETDTRNTDSNLYRTVENGDLKYTISHNNFWFGMGFGKPYLQPIPLTSLFQAIGSADIYYEYVPHNNIYWVWMRLGAIGFLAFWYLIGSIMVYGSLHRPKATRPLPADSCDLRRLHDCCGDNRRICRLSTLFLSQCDLCWVAGRHSGETSRA